MSEQPTLETVRLRLRPFRPDDAADVQRLAGDIEVARNTLLIPHPYPDGVAEEWIAGHALKFVRDEEAVFAVTLRETGGLVGAVGLILNRQHARAELGYWIGRPYWNRGFATEATEAVVRFGFEHLRLGRIVAFHMRRNPGSGRVMQKLGMICEGHLREHVLKWNTPEDVEAYGILRREWGRCGDT